MFEKTVFKKLSTRQWKTKILESQERDQVTPWQPRLLPWESFQTVRLRRRIWEALRRSPELETDLRVQADRAATVHRTKYMRRESFTERRPPDTCRRSLRSVQQRTNQHRVRGNHPRLRTGQSTKREQYTALSRTRKSACPIRPGNLTIHRTSVMENNYPKLNRALVLPNKS